ncbi:MAG: hypothetical protein VYA34_08470 [Myxococcota bacterium]|nr:hypothetical protein [Myxococcota bacterium]
MVLPNLIPEVGYHIGVSDNWEIGGRVVFAAGLLELDAKYRFLRTADDDLHMAILPALGYRALGPINGISASLPVVTTWDVNEILSLNIAPFVSYTNFNTTDADFGSLSGSALSAGGSLGFQLNADTMYFMPSIELSKIISNFSDSSNSASTNNIVMMLGLTIGFNQGREMAKLEKMDDKLDKLGDKLDSIKE